ncbi:hypothetical protein E3N88_07990 [Mikania micrantha]|uniref:Proline-rich protein n=1 Tax=Mikania micrantha TaxID=192012 RepID=A0A5N6PI25_9ASTR|nr:hypothetical protein E3N88_07990 [Mikania micrantha]
MHTNLFFLFLFTSTLIFITATTLANHEPLSEHDIPELKKPPHHGLNPPKEVPPIHRPPRPPHNGYIPQEIETEATHKPPHKGGKPPHDGHKLPPKKKPPHGGHPPTEIDAEAAYKPPQRRRPPRGRPPKLDTKP